MFTFPGSINSNNEAPTDITRGLVHRWTFNEGTGPSIADSVGGVNLTANGGMGWGTGRVGQYAGNFDGSDDYAGGNSSSFILGDNMTICAWVKLDTLQTFNEIICKGERGVDWSDYRLCIEDGGFRFFHRYGPINGNWATVLGGSGNPSVGEWYHVAGIYDGANLKIYVNGIEDGTAVYTQTTYSDGNDLSIGEFLNTENRNFDGLIDDVRLYNVTLTAEEVNYIANKANRSG